MMFKKFRRIKVNLGTANKTPASKVSGPSIRQNSRASNKDNAETLRSQEAS